MIRRYIVAMLLLSSVVIAQDPPPGFTWHSLQLSGLLDIYTATNFNHPTSNYANWRFFDYRTGQLSLNMAKISVEKSDTVVGFRVDAGLGQAFRGLHGSDPAPKAFRYFDQMYLSLKPKASHGLEIDFGQFLSSAAVEVFDNNNNWNYSRSLQFAWATPNYHFGLKTTLPVTKELTVSAQLVNGWTNLWNEPKFQTVGLTGTWTRKKYAVTKTWYGGAIQGGNRQMNEVIVSLTPTDKLAINTDTVYGRFNATTGIQQRWYNVDLLGRYQLTPKIAVASRIAYYDDAAGFTLGAKQIIHSATATSEYKFNKRYITRLEFRHDHSTRKIFNVGSIPQASNDLNTLTAGFLFVLTPTH